MTDQFNDEAARYANRLLEGSGHPVGAPDPDLAGPIRGVGVVGAGVMAAQIALLMAQRLDVPVAMRDVTQELVDKGLAHVRSSLDRQVAKGRITAERAGRILARIDASTDIAVFSGCDLVIEAVTEDLAVKRTVLAQLEGIVGPGAVLATNTSALSVTVMAEGLEHPERVVGLHFFNPVAAMPLVEVVHTGLASRPALATAFQVAGGLGKTAVSCSDRPGFVANRLLCLVIGEPLKAIRAGTPVEVADAALDPLGLPMRVLELLGLVGTGVGLHVLTALNERLGARYPVPDALRTIVEEDVPLVGPAPERGARRPVNPQVQQIFDAARPAGADTSAAPDSAGVLDATLTALTREIDMMLQEGAVKTPGQIDLAMLLGASWPKELGGITPYLDHSGYSQRVLGHRLHAEHDWTIPGGRQPALS